MDAYADAGFKVGVILPVAHHIERNGAVGEEDFTCLHINPGRICLEAGKTGQGLGNHHRKKRRYISFTGGGEAVGVERCKRQAAGIAY